MTRPTMRPARPAALATAATGATGADTTALPAPRNHHSAHVIGSAAVLGIASAGALVAGVLPARATEPPRPTATASRSSEATLRRPARESASVECGAENDVLPMPAPDDRWIVTFDGWHNGHMTMTYTLTAGHTWDDGTTTPLVYDYVDLATACASPQPSAHITIAAPVPVYPPAAAPVPTTTSSSTGSSTGASTPGSPASSKPRVKGSGVKRAAVKRTAPKRPPVKKTAKRAAHRRTVAGRTGLTTAAGMVAARAAAHAAAARIAATGTAVPRVSTAWRATTAATMRSTGHTTRPVSRSASRPSTVRWATTAQRAAASTARRPSASGSPVSTSHAGATPRGAGAATPLVPAAGTVVGAAVLAPMARRRRR